MRFVYFLRTRAAYIVFVFMFLICIVSFIVAGKETLIAYKKQNQEIGSPQVAGSKNIEHDKSKLPTLKNVNEVPLYFNGRRVEGLLSFTSSKGEVMFPIDDIFNYLKIDYTYHYADGIIEASLNDCIVIIKVDSDTFTINGIAKQLPFAVTLFNDRVMVPAELLNELNGFSASGKAYMSSAFVDYNPDYKARAIPDIYYLGSTLSTTGIYNINGGRFINISEKDDKTLFDYSPIRQSILYKRNDRAYYITKSMDFLPEALNMGILSQWTDDFKSIYEADDNFNKLNIYSPDSGKIKTLENVRQLITSNTDFEDFSTGALRLISFWNYNKTTRIKVLNTISNKVCTILYQNDKPILVATAFMSPTGRYMAYTKYGRFRLCAFDGEQDVSLDDAEAVRWVTDDTLMIMKNGEWDAYDTLGKIQKKQDNNLSLLGVTEDQNVLFKDSGAIYRSVNGVEDKIVDVNMNLECAVASSDFYTLAAGNRYDNSLYLIHNSEAVKIGEYYAMLKSRNTKGYSEDIGRSVKFSPDGKKVCAALLDKNMVVLKVIDQESSQTDEIRIDSDAYLRSQYGTADLKFIDNNTIVYYDRNYIWVICLCKAGPEIAKFPKTGENMEVSGIMIN